ncbi:hypothetical protein Z043_122128 [Scleropages formosus]|uniref:Zinc finger CCHC domain-containing protein 17 n=1 Tax=Scleropages formosus TaxID=113540 RepID=A0A0P7WFI5_SCLFO|nr:hypothetical protein Z043_122128 [Scleropages formosus]
MMEGHRRGREQVTMDELPELYSVLRGEVASVTAYGAFVKIPGCRKQGLVHKSEMSSCRVENPSEIVDVGEQVWVKVIGREIQDDKVKLSFSMKVVNQGTGKDLDPNNVILEQDERKRRQFRDFASQKITLEAVLNTTCKKCGCRGHFAKDCFSQPGLQYSLVPEDEGAAAEPSGQSTHAQLHGTKKEKKTKKMKRKRDNKQSSDSDSNDGHSAPKKRCFAADPGAAEERKRRKRKKKEKKKHKKEKHRSHRKQE